MSDFPDGMTDVAAKLYHLASRVQSGIVVLEAERDGWRRRAERAEAAIAPLRAFVAGMRKTYPLSPHIQARIAALDVGEKEVS